MLDLCTFILDFLMLLLCADGGYLILLIALSWPEGRRLWLGIGGTCVEDC